MHSLITILQNIGYSKLESKVYIAVLHLGEPTVSEVATYTNIKRTSIYVILKSLTTKGIVATYTKKKIKHLVATNPKIVIERARDQAQKAYESLPLYQALIPDDKIIKPQVSYYSGIKGLITIMEDTLLTPNKTIYTWANLDDAWNTLKDYYPTYIKKKIKQNIFNKAICTSNDRAMMFQQKSKKEHREILLIKEKTYPMYNEISIYDNKISIISHKDKIGVIIENKKIAQTQRTIFELCWNNIKI